MRFFRVFKTDFEVDESNEDFTRSDPTSRSGRPRSSHPRSDEEEEEEEEAMAGSSSRSRSVSPLRVPLIDVDPEAVRVALKKFANRLATTEREKVNK